MSRISQLLLNWNLNLGFWIYPVGDNCLSDTYPNNVWLCNICPTSINSKIIVFLLKFVDTYSSVTTVPMTFVQIQFVISTIYMWGLSPCRLVKDQAVIVFLLYQNQNYLWLGLNRNRNISAEIRNLPGSRFRFRFLVKRF